MDTMMANLDDNLLIEEQSGQNEETSEPIVIEDKTSAGHSMLYTTLTNKVLINR